MSVYNLHKKHLGVAGKSNILLVHPKKSWRGGVCTFGGEWAQVKQRGFLHENREFVVYTVGLSAIQIVYEVLFFQFVCVPSLWHLLSPFLYPFADCPSPRLYQGSVPSPRLFFPISQAPCILPSNTVLFPPVDVSAALVKKYTNAYDCQFNDFVNSSFKYPALTCLCDYKPDFK